MRLLPHSAPVPLSGVTAETVIRAATDRPWMLLAFRVVLLTSATVATRVLTLAIKDGAGSVIWKDRLTQVEGVEYEFNFAHGTPRGSGGIATALAVFAPLPEGLWIQPSWSVSLVVDAAEADDTISLGQMVYALLWDEDGEPYAEEFEDE